MDNLITFLRLAHILLFIVVFIFGWGAYKVAQFKNKDANFAIYLTTFIIFMFILGFIVHRCNGIKTKLGYVLGLNSYPRYQLY